jgi:outer membrane receptor protein involved in Fe transport
VNRTTELNAVYRLPRTAVRGTLFISRIDDMIYAAGPTRFDNSRSGRARGFELEWEQQLTPNLKLQSNVSFTDAEDDRNTERVLTTPGVVAKWLGNLSVLFRATPRLLLAGRATYVGDRSTPTDARGYTVVDVAITRNDLFVPGLQLRTGVKNAFDDEPRYYVGGRPGLAGSYLTYPGRTFFAQIAFTR